ncbi:uncharacterized protein METZ01_LOCUS21490 [marine metagenome]|uniref:Uncharacterized protein n=1 Tax=marine metagenome TaxID=408172 RepID=A0A381PNN3_9ZZZZ
MRPDPRWGSNFSRLRVRQASHVPLSSVANNSDGARLADLLCKANN